MVRWIHNTVFGVRDSGYQNLKSTLRGFFWVIELADNAVYATVIPPTAVMCPCFGDSSTELTYTALW